MTAREFIDKYGYGVKEYEVGEIRVIYKEGIVTRVSITTNFWYGITHRVWDNTKTTSLKTFMKKTSLEMSLLDELKRILDEHAGYSVIVISVPKWYRDGELFVARDPEKEKRDIHTYIIGHYPNPKLAVELT